MSNVYDKAFRTIVNECRQLVLPFLNEVFGEHYDGTEKVVFQPNEHFFVRQNNSDAERITDTNFTVIGETSKKYHLECESSTYNRKMLVRIFEYDAQIALDEGELGTDSIKVKFPNTAVLYLRDTGKTPNLMKVEIETPGGQVAYFVSVVKMRLYSIDEIFEKRLYILIPFYIFTYERKFDKYNGDEEKLSELNEEFEGILARLTELVECEKISSYDMKMIVRLSSKVIKALTRKYKNVNEKVGGIMSRGPMFVTEERKILDEGIRQGRKDIIAGALRKGKSAEDVAIFIDVSIDEVLAVQKELETA